MYVGMQTDMPIHRAAMCQVFQVRVPAWSARGPCSTSGEGGGVDVGGGCDAETPAAGTDRRGSDGSGAAHAPRLRNRPAPSGSEYLPFSTIVFPPGESTV